MKEWQEDYKNVKAFDNLKWALTLNKFDKTGCYPPRSSKHKFFVTKTNLNQWRYFI